MNGIIDAVIIDTSAFMKEQSDFIGMNSAIIPSFFSLIEKQNIELISHEILIREIKKNVRESTLIEKLSNLKETIKKYKNVLPLVHISPEDTIMKIDGLELERQIIEAFDKFYSKATLLPYPNPESVFGLYFASKAPFSETGKKKHEFPDAFVTEAIKQFQKTRPYCTVLVVSDDPDWKAALAGLEHILLADSLADGMKILQSSENVIPIFAAIKDALEEEILDTAMSECYDLRDIELEEDIDITSIILKEIDDDITLLEISESSLLFRTYASLEIAGRSAIIDDDRSPWDKEDGRYMWVEYIDITFQNGIADIECEVSIAFDSDNPVDTASVESVKIIAKYNIEINVDEDDIDYASRLNDDDNT